MNIVVLRLWRHKRMARSLAASTRFHLKWLPRLLGSSVCLVAWTLYTPVVQADVQGHKRAARLERGYSSLHALHDMTAVVPSHLHQAQRAPLPRLAEAGVSRQYPARRRLLRRFLAETRSVLDAMPGPARGAVAEHLRAMRSRAAIRGSRSDMPHYHQGQLEALGITLGADRYTLRRSVEDGRLGIELGMVVDATKIPNAGQLVAESITARITPDSKSKAGAPEANVTVDCQHRFCTGSNNERRVSTEVVVEGHREATYTENGLHVKPLDLEAVRATARALEAALGEGPVGNATPIERMRLTAHRLGNGGAVEVATFAAVKVPSVPEAQLMIWRRLPQSQATGEDAENRAASLEMLIVNGGAAALPLPLGLFGGEEADVPSHKYPTARGGYVVPPAEAVQLSVR